MSPGRPHSRYPRGEPRNPAHASPKHPQRSSRIPSPAWVWQVRVTPLPISPARTGGRPAAPKNDPAAWGRGTRKGACLKGSIRPRAHLGVAELHHHVLAAPSRRHLPRPDSAVPGLRVPTHDTRVPGFGEPHAAPSQSSHAPSPLPSGCKPLADPNTGSAPSSRIIQLRHRACPKTDTPPYFVTRLESPTLLAPVNTRPLPRALPGVVGQGLATCGQSAKSLQVKVWTRGGTSLSPRWCPSQGPGRI